MNSHALFTVIRAFIGHLWVTRLVQVHQGHIFLEYLSVTVNAVRLDQIPDQPVDHYLHFSKGCQLPAEKQTNPIQNLTALVDFCGGRKTQYIVTCIGIV